MKRYLINVICHFRLSIFYLVERDIFRAFHCYLYFYVYKVSTVFIACHTSCANDTWGVSCQTIYANIVSPRWDLFIGEPRSRAAFRSGSSAASPHRRVASHRIGNTRSTRNCSNELILAQKLYPIRICAYTHARIPQRELRRPRSFGVWRQNAAPTSSRVSPVAQTDSNKSTITYIRRLKSNRGDGQMSLCREIWRIRGPAVKWNGKRPNYTSCFA